MENSDWIMLHRKSLESRVFSDARLWHLWCWCLLRSNWKRSWYAGCDLQPGQFACGREAASAELGISGSAWYRGMQKLQELGCIKLIPNNRFTIVSIVNWPKYQRGRTTDEQQMNNKRTTDEQQADTEEEGKEIKERKNYSLTPSRELSSHWGDEDFQSAWFRWLAHVAEKAEPITGPAEQEMLYKLEIFTTADAIEVVKYSILKQAKNLILNGDHKPEQKQAGQNGRGKPKMEIVVD